MADKSVIEIPSQIEDHVRLLQSTASTQIRSFGRLFDSLKARFYCFLIGLELHPMRINLNLLKGYMGDTQNFEQTVENLIDTKIEMYHNDRTGLPDYAIDTAGGTIIEYRSTPSMNSGRKTSSKNRFDLIKNWLISDLINTHKKPESLTFGKISMFFSV